MNPIRGILLKLMAVTLFGVMAILVKTLSSRVPAGEIVFFRSLVALPVIVIWLMSLGELRHGLRTRKPLSHVWRGLVGTSAMALNFAALGLLPLPEVTALGYAMPILVVAFAAMFLGEDVGFFRFLMVMIGLLGVLIVLSPRLQGLDAAGAGALGAACALGGALCGALAQVFIRQMIHTEHAAAIVFWFSITATLLSLFTLPGWVMPGGDTLGLLLLTGLIGGVGQIFLTSAYRFADASVIAPFEYASMIIALVAGYFLFGEVPTLVMLAGASVIMTAGIAIIVRERQLQIERGKARRAGATPPA
jgi:drug/metabolite transporter (DMT)-like permease